LHQILQLFIAFSRTLMTSQGMMRMISSVWNV
jgi:hypothetical protein